ncbi:MAG TPA: CAP domain-containing protein [Candidatus Paceibacterota bacterium]|nr:CAP domain-containing protein [Candidatus Paceibacterota bacterium]
MNAEHYKKRAKHRLVVLSVIVCVAGAAIWYFAAYSSLSEVTLIGNSIEQFAAVEATKSFLAPPPLTATSTGVRKPFIEPTPLTEEGVIAQTNIQRENNGSLPPLAENQLLDDIATLRLEDMFANQYFAHVSPTGESALTVASDVGYSYLGLGENLALGDFSGDAGVVAAWMNSPGHRANILEKHYSEIGVAVGKGMFKGEDEWIAVQVFGRPASACPSVDPDLKTSIDVGQNTLNAMATELSNDDAAINATEQKYGPDYNQKVGAYNALVQQYNALTTQLKQEISQYNTQVNAFNACLAD